MSMNKNTESRTNKFSVGNLVKGRMKPEASPGFSRLPMLGYVTSTGIDYPDTGTKRSKYAEIKWSNGTNSTIHLCYGIWDRIAVVG